MLDTIAARHIGDRLTVTAGVKVVLDIRAFVVRDVDLPDRGLLVLGDPPRDLHAPDLVTVTGTIQRFEFRRFAESYALRDEASYIPFEGQKMMIADRVKSWA